MDLTIYDVIQGPVISEKASHLISSLNKIVLRVHPKANKRMIKQALEKLFNVEVKAIRTTIRKGKSRRFRRIESTGKLSKRAIVTLKPGYSLDFVESTVQQGPIGQTAEQ